jgi:tRNA (uracil-5-)-methyltransferase
MNVLWWCKVECYHCIYFFCIYFGLGINEETGERTVGFRLGSYVQGFTGVGPVDCLRHIPDRMKEAAKVLER